MSEIAVVTGAACGIGLEVCRQLAQRRMTVILTAHDPVAGMRAVASLGEECGDVRFHPLDVTDQASVDTLVQSVRETFGHLDVLVNNTTEPVGAQAPSWAQKPNLLGVWLVTLALLPLLRTAHNARIVNVARIQGAPASEAGRPSGKYANAGRSAGNVVARAAMHAVTGALARDLADTDILVNAVCPSYAANPVGGVPGNGVPGGGVPGSAASGRDVPGGGSTGSGLVSGAPGGAQQLTDLAAGIVWAATLPPDGPRGGLFLDRAPQPW